MLFKYCTALCKLYKTQSSALYYSKFIEPSFRNLLTFSKELYFFSKQLFYCTFCRKIIAFERRHEINLWFLERTRHLWNNGFECEVSYTENHKYSTTLSRCLDNFSRLKTQNQLHLSSLWDQSNTLTYFSTSQTNQYLGSYNRSKFWLQKTLFFWEYSLFSMIKGIDLSWAVHALKTWAPWWNVNIFGNCTQN